LILIVGSGIIGSWVAYQVSQTTSEDVIVCDFAENRGDGISGRNSGVLHSGIYYPKDSQKLKHCLRGYELSLEFLNKNQVPYHLCGKYITIGSHGDLNHKTEKLHALYEKAKNYEILNTSIVENLETDYPYLKGKYALTIPKTGVVSVPEYLRSLWKMCENQGVIFLKGKRCILEGDSIFLIDQQDHSREKIEVSAFINAAGLYSDELINQSGYTDYEIRPNKGEYFRLKKTFPIQKLVYPLPEEKSTALGVHYTFHLNGEAYAGPNSNWAKNKTDYAMQTPRKVFYDSLCNITDFYNEEDLSEGYVGLRPRLFHKGEAHTDFLIKQFPENRPWVHLLGIESPGLTSSPSIGEEVATLVRSFL
jgi:L-2-hydroxyglutarate oxidase LhgO